MFLVKKIGPILFLILILAFVIYQTQPPKSLSQASFLQITSFFLPLFLLLLYFFNLFFKFLIRSLIISLALIIFLILQALSFLNIITLPLIIFITVFLFIKIKKPNKFNYQTKIPKLSHLSKQR